MHQLILAMDPRQLSDEELVRLCLDTKDEALREVLWAEFIRRFQRTIAGVIVKRIRFRTGRMPEPDLVDDLIYETIFKICDKDFKALRGFQFQHANSLYGFLKVISVNAVEDYFRSSKNLKRGGEYIEEPLEKVQAVVPVAADVVETADRAILFREIIEYLQKKLAGQPNAGRDVTIFLLYFKEGFTSKAIAGRPEVTLTVKGVETLLLRLTRLIRAELGSPPVRKKKASGTE